MWLEIKYNLFSFHREEKKREDIIKISGNVSPEFISRIHICLFKRAAQMIIQF